MKKRVLCLLVVILLLASSSVVTASPAEGWASIGGGIAGQGSQGQGAGKGRPTHSFGGHVSNVGGTIQGRVVIRYHDLKKTCVFTPDGDAGFAIVSGVVILTDWANSCGSEDADLTLKGRESFGPRGRIEVDDTGTTFDIADTLLDRGNVHVRVVVP